MLNTLFRLSETFDRFEIKSQLRDQMLGESSDEVGEMEIPLASNESVREATAISQQNKSEIGEQCHIVSIDTFSFCYQQYIKVSLLFVNS